MIPKSSDINNSSYKILDLFDESGNFGAEELKLSLLFLLTKRKYLQLSSLGINEIEGFPDFQVRQTFMIQFSSINGLPSQYFDQYEPRILSDNSSTSFSPEINLFSIASVHSDSEAMKQSSLWMIS